MIRAVHAGKKALSPEASFELAEHATDDGPQPGGAQILGGGAVHDARHVRDAGTVREAVEHLPCLYSAIGSKDVELCSLNHQLAGGDAAGKLAVDDEETRTNHLAIMHKHCSLRLVATFHGIKGRENG